MLTLKTMKNDEGVTRFVTTDGTDFAVAAVAMFYMKLQADIVQQRNYRLNGKA